MSWLIRFATDLIALQVMQHLGLTFWQSVGVVFLIVVGNDLPDLVQAVRREAAEERA